ncbi:MAG: hypothetical protein PHG66_05235 [Candidatus Colwellbacteria bacterium]|nr:hypothetical protein [Candidatus Colwellbacteria bacterium]
MDNEGKKTPKMTKWAAIALVLAFVLGLGISYIAGKRGKTPEIRIEKCSAYR